MSLDLKKLNVLIQLVSWYPTLKLHLIELNSIPTCPNMFFIVNYLQGLFHRRVNYSYGPLSTMT